MHILEMIEAAEFMKPFLEPPLGITSKASCKMATPCSTEVAVIGK